MESSDRLRHTGQCHCGAIKFAFVGSSNLLAWDCNCSICALKRNVHCVVPENDFELLEGRDNLSTYTFNTGVAKHTFCKTCGVVPFYRPRSNPEGYAVTVACVAPATVRSIIVRTIDGQNWEQAVPASGIQKLTASEA